MDSASDVKLKPCPFCGGEAELFSADEGIAGMVQCVPCLAIIHGNFDTDAIAAWNRRTTCQGTGTVIDTEGSEMQTSYSNTELASGKAFSEVYGHLRNMAKRNPGQSVSCEMTSDLRAIDGQISQVVIEITIIPASTGQIVDIKAEA